MGQCGNECVHFAEDGHIGRVDDVKSKVIWVGRGCRWTPLQRQVVVYTNRVRGLKLGGDRFIARLFACCSSHSRSRDVDIAYETARDEGRWYADTGRKGGTERLQGDAC